MDDPASRLKRDLLRMRERSTPADAETINALLISIDDRERSEVELRRQLVEPHDFTPADLADDQWTGEGPR